MAYTSVQAKCFPSEKMDELKCAINTWTISSPKIRNNRSTPASPIRACQKRAQAQRTDGERLHMEKQEDDVPHVSQVKKCSLKLKKSCCQNKSDISFFMSSKAKIPLSLMDFRQIGLCFLPNGGTWNLPKLFSHHGLSHGVRRRTGVIFQILL